MLDNKEYTVFIKHMLYDRFWTNLGIIDTVMTIFNISIRIHIINQNIHVLFIEQIEILLILDIICCNQ